MASAKLGAVALPRSPVIDTELNQIEVLDPAPPPARMPTVRSGSVARLTTFEIMLLTMTLVPDAACATATPAAEAPATLVEAIPLITFRPTVVLVTSSPE